MVKEGSGFEADEENEQCDRVDTEENDGEREERDREKHFAEMKSRGRADVEVEIGMMDVVKSPKERDHMVNPVPPPIGIIHEQKRGVKRYRSRQVDPVQQTKISTLRPDADGQRDRQHKKPDNRES